jgi:hypothetical protein
MHLLLLLLLLSLSVCVTADGDSALVCSWTAGSSTGLERSLVRSAAVEMLAALCFMPAW